MCRCFQFQLQCWEMMRNVGQLGSPAEGCGSVVWIQEWGRVGLVGGAEQGSREQGRERGADETGMLGHQHVGEGRGQVVGEQGAGCEQVVGEQQTGCEQVVGEQQAGCGQVVGEQQAGCEHVVGEQQAGCGQVVGEQQAGHGRVEWLGTGPPRQ